MTAPVGGEGWSSEDVTDEEWTAAVCEDWADDLGDKFQDDCMESLLLHLDQPESAR